MWRKSSHRKYSGRRRWAKLQPMCFRSAESLEGRLLLSVSWTGPSGGFWATPGNWSDDAQPTSTTDVVIASGANVVINNTADAAGVNAASGSTITIDGGDRLALGADSSTFAGTLTLNVSSSDGLTVGAARLR